MKLFARKHHKESTEQAVAMFADSLRHDAQFRLMIWLSIALHLSLLAVGMRYFFNYSESVAAEMLNVSDKTPVMVDIIDNSEIVRIRGKKSAFQASSPIYVPPSRFIAPEPQPAIAPTPPPVIPEKQAEIAPPQSSVIPEQKLLPKPTDPPKATPIPKNTPKVKKSTPVPKREISVALVKTPLPTITPPPEPLPTSQPEITPIPTLAFASMTTLPALPQEPHPVAVAAAFDAATPMTAMPSNVSGDKVMSDRTMELPGNRESREISKEIEEQNNRKTAAPQAQDQFDQYLGSIIAKIRAAAVYPQQARRRKWEGTVTVELQIEPSGKVRKMTIVDAAPYDLLNDAALKAIKRAQPFPSFDQANTAELLTVKIPIQFELKNPE